MSDVEESSVDEAVAPVISDPPPLIEKWRQIRNELASGSQSGSNVAGGDGQPDNPGLGGLIFILIPF